LTSELLATFVRVIGNGGIASATARQLGINQASMSKRLAHRFASTFGSARTVVLRIAKMWGGP
jgi:hypothetical protein